MCASKPPQLVRDGVDVVETRRCPIGPESRFLVRESPSHEIGGGQKTLRWFNVALLLSQLGKVLMVCARSSSILSEEWGSVSEESNDVW
mmetsp:Transcript_15508/g.31367  ORF Transcript_15508/g.31367 Transcript_15508/m.31367 type:complete len:89 (+) Transcript_15508:5015-5281(+)